MNGFKTLPKMKAFKTGGSVSNFTKRDRKSTSADIKQDKAIVKKAIAMHDKQEHPGEKTNLTKLRKGGRAKKAVGTVKKFMKPAAAPSAALKAKAKDTKASGDKDKIKKVAAKPKKAAAPSAATKGKTIKKFADGGLTGSVIQDPNYTGSAPISVPSDTGTGIMGQQTATPMASRPVVNETGYGTAIPPPPLPTYGDPGPIVGKTGYGTAIPPDLATPMPRANGTYGQVGTQTGGPTLGNIQNPGTGTGIGMTGQLPIYATDGAKYSQPIRPGSPVPTPPQTILRPMPTPQIRPGSPVPTPPQTILRPMPQGGMFNQQPQMGGFNQQPQQNPINRLTAPTAPLFGRRFKEGGAVGVYSAKKKSGDMDSIKKAKDIKPKLLCGGKSVQKMQAGGQPNFQTNPAAAQDALDTQENIATRNTVMNPARKAKKFILDKLSGLSPMNAAVSNIGTPSSNPMGVGAPAGSTTPGGQKRGGKVKRK